MTIFQNASHSNKWACPRCNTWCSVEVKRCSWCGGGRPGTRDEATITDSPGIPDQIREEQLALNKLRLLITKLNTTQKAELLHHIEEKYKV